MPNPKSPEPQAQPGHAAGRAAAARVATTLLRLLRAQPMGGDARLLALRLLARVLPSCPVNPNPNPNPDPDPNPNPNLLPSCPVRCLTSASHFYPLTLLLVLYPYYHPTTTLLLRTDCSLTTTYPCIHILSRSCSLQRRAT